MYTCLVCDDEKDIVNAIKIYLESEGYQVLCAYNGQEALDILDQNEVHVVLIDLMMPVMDGIKAISIMRQTTAVPIIILSAKGENYDKVMGLNIGADDYVTKPFDPLELIARVKSNVRRYTMLSRNSVETQEVNGNSQNIRRVGGIVLDNNTKLVTVDGEKITLTKTEYAILKLFMDNIGVVLSPKQIYEQVWNEVSLSGENTVAVHIRHLREKIEINPSEPRYLKAVWGYGYKMERGKRENG